MEAMSPPQLNGGAIEFILSIAFILSIMFVIIANTSAVFGVGVFGFGGTFGFAFAIPNCLASAEEELLELLDKVALVRVFLTLSFTMSSPVASSLLHTPCASKNVVLYPSFKNTDKGASLPSSAFSSVIVNLRSVTCSTFAFRASRPFPLTSL